MAISPNIKDREYNKFCDLNGETAVRTCTTVEGGIIEASPSGLKNGFLVTTMTVSDTAIPIPALALIDRNSISIVNLDTVETLFIGPNNSVQASQALGTTSGWEVGPNETYNVDVKDTVVLYGIVSSGKTILIKVFQAS